MTEKPSLMDRWVAQLWPDYSVSAIARHLSKELRWPVSAREVYNAKQRIDGRARPGLQMKGSGDADHIPLRDRVD